MFFMFEQKILCLERKDEKWAKAGKALIDVIGKKAKILLIAKYYTVSKIEIL